MGLKLGLIGMAAMAVLATWLYIQVQAKDLEIAAQASEIQHLTTALEVSEGNLATQESLNAVQLTQIDAFQEKVAQMDAERAEALSKVAYMQGLFNGHDFNKLLQAKPGLIETRMQKATAVVLKELEDAADPTLTD